MGFRREPILYIAPWIDLGGSDRATVDWFKHIDRERWAPSLITTTTSPNRWLGQVEPYAEEVWNLPDLMPGSAFPEFILGFIESREVRLVHIMNARLGFDLLPDMTCLPEPPSVVVQLHAEEPNQTGYVRYVSRRYGNLIDAFSVVSVDLKQTMVGYDIPPSRIEVIYLGVDARGEFDPGAVDPLPLREKGAKRILWPGRLVEQKDPLLTVEVVARARELGGEFVVDVVGDGHLKEEAQACAERLGVGGMFRWHPASKEMARWYRSSDLVLMTSLYEGVPLVLYEALAMGVPVVAPALAGNLELMNGDGGRLIDPRDDVDAYAEAIVSLLGDEGRRSDVGRRARERMLQDFSLEQMGRRHDELYERLLSGRAATSRWRNEELLGDAEPGPHRPEPPPPPLRLPRDPLPPATVGVVVPCYRHGLFLEECVASIKAQTVPVAQIVVVDDCSEDEETVAALARIEADPDVTVIRQPGNAGPSAARNRGLQEIDTSYFLPLDADDQLLPDAVERMLNRLEAAPEHVGYVYPYPRFIGNQDDEFQPPDYNAWLLMEQNYCAAPALFDRRLFGGSGVSYPEEIVVGHEDWDLILQLVERGVEGIPADRPTFLYRKQGFSRVNAVDYGPLRFQETIERRHPSLYLNREEVKARWAPALSIVLLDEEGVVWNAADLGAFDEQTCRDFELFGSSEIAPGVRAPRVAAADDAAWVQGALNEVRGRWVLLLPRAAATEISPAFVEQLIHAFVANAGTQAIVLAQAPDIHRARFSQLDDRERLSAQPVAVAFERPIWGLVPEIPLGREGTVLADLTLGLQAMGATQWRLAGSEHAAPWGPYAGRSPSVGALDLNLPDAPTASGRLMRHRVVHQPPLLPELTAGTIRRWGELDSWAPAQAQLLCRHRDPVTGVRVVTLDRRPPAGFELEVVLGSTRLFPAPGARRLVHANHGFELREAGELGEGEFELGYIEGEALPMLVGLELRRIPGSGQVTLAASDGIDPLVFASEKLDVLGWIEPYPILPRADEVLHTGPWGARALRRRVEPKRWRHAYWTEEPAAEGEGIELAYLHPHPLPSLVALRLRSDGRLASELCTPGRASRDPRKLARWLAEPARSGGGPARMPGAGRRLGRLAFHPGARRLAEEEGEVLGYLRRYSGLGAHPLYSTIHPATGDQLVTRYPEGAGKHGYVLDGVLGFATGLGDSAKALEQPLPWGRLEPSGSD